MRAGAHKRRAHESRQCVGRRISCSITSRRAAKYGRAESPAHTRPPRGRSERRRPSGAPLSSVPAARWRSARPTPLRRTWARSPSGRRVPRQGANEVVPGVGVAGPRTRLVGKEGVPMTRLVPLAWLPCGQQGPPSTCRKGGTGTCRGGPGPPPAPAGGERGLIPQAGQPLVRRSQVGDGPRRVAQPREPRLHDIVPFRALPQDVGLVLVRRAAVGARGVSPHAVARHSGRGPHGPDHETAQQRRLQLRGGGPQRRATGWAVRPVA